MAVADLKQRAAHVDGNEERRARDQLFVVKVAGVNPRRGAADAAIGFRRRDAHTAEERAQRDLNAVAEPPHHTLFIQRNDLHLRVREILWQKPGAWPER